MDSQEITWALQELRHVLRGARFQKARDDGEHTLALSLRGQGRTLHLILSIDASRARLHLAPSPKLTPSWRRRLRDHLCPPSTPPPPQAFTATARRWLAGLALVDIVQAPADRLVALLFARPNDTVTGDDDLSADADTPDTSDDPADPADGADAAAPADATDAPQGGCALLCALIGTRANLWLRDDQGRTLALEPARRAPPPPALLALTPQPLMGDPPPDDLPINRLICAQGDAEAEATALRAAQAWVRGAIQKAQKKQRRLVAALQSDARRAEDASKDKDAADLLSAHFHLLRRGMAEVTVPNLLGDGAPVTLALDPALKPSENVARRYRRYKKYSAAQDIILERLIDAEARAESLDRAAADAAAAAGWPDLLGVARRCLDARLVPAPLLVPGGASARAAAKAKAKAKPTQRLPYKTFTSRAGHVIWVGRGAPENDALTFRYARGNDTWLHAVGWPGSHVILRAVGAQPPDPDALLDAATLAVHFSKGRADALVEVHHTRCKYVRKPKGAPAGSVTVQGPCAVLPLRLDDARLQRLLQQAPD